MLTATASNAMIRGSYVDYEVEGKPHQAYLTVDPELKGARPGVLLCHEWWGVNDFAKRRARELAQQGYVVMVVDMFGKGITTDKAEEAQKLVTPFYQDRALFRSRMSAALAQLKMQSNVDTMRLGVIGFCFGGTAALELARSGADVKGVVSFHGGLSNPTPDDAKNIKGQVLILHGADDPFVPEEEVAAFEEEMKAAQVKYELIAYPEAVHAFTNPAQDGVKLSGAKYNEYADKASNEAMLKLFAKLFEKKE